MAPRRLFGHASDQCRLDGIGYHAHPRSLRRTLQRRACCTSASGTASQRRAASVSIESLQRGMWANVPWTSILSGKDPLDVDTLRGHLAATSGTSNVPGARPRICVSGCLLGHAVTYRGKPSGWSSKQERRRGRTGLPTAASSPLAFAIDVLGHELGLLEWVPFCPEMEILGLTAPRHPVRLVSSPVGFPSTEEKARDADRRRVVINAITGFELWDYDHNKLLRVSRKAARGSGHLWNLPPSFGTLRDVAQPPTPVGDGSSSLYAWLSGADGIVLKAKSPSCGLGDAKMRRDSPSPAGQRDQGPCHPLQPHDLAQIKKQGEYPAPILEASDGFFAKWVKDELSTLSDGEPKPALASEKSLKLHGDSVVNLVAFLDAVLTRAEWRIAS